jgi:hypothetical protein
LHYFPTDDIVGGGRFAFGLNSTTDWYAIMNGADGSYWIIHAVAGMRPVPDGMVFRSDTEFAFALAPAGTTTPTTVRRLRLDALGPPLPALP